MPKLPNQKCNPTNPEKEPADSTIQSVLFIEPTILCSEIELGIFAPLKREFESYATRL